MVEQPNLQDGDLSGDQDDLPLRLHRLQRLS